MMLNAKWQRRKMKGAPVGALRVIKKRFRGEMSGSELRWRWALLGDKRRLGDANRQGSSRGLRAGARLTLSSCARECYVKREPEWLQRPASLFHLLFASSQLSRARIA